MKERTPHPCPVCGSFSERLFCEPWVEESDPAKLYGAASGIPGTQRLVQCTDCGMIYESPRYGAETIVQGYISSQEAEHDSQYPMRVKSFYLTLKKLANLIPAPGAKILDIGTAGGRSAPN